MKQFFSLASLKNLFLVVLGTFILAFGISVFILPFDLTIGGTSNLAIIITRLIKVKFLTTELIIGIITWTLFFLGLIFFGKNFALKTLVSTIVFPISVSVSSYIATPDFLGGFFCLTESKYSEIAMILGAFIGGILIGVGCALAFIGGGSTGGTDILAFIICKFFKKLKSSTAIFITDAIFVLLGVFIIKDLAISLLGIISVFISSAVIDKMFLGQTRAFVAQIVSNEYEAINKAIAERLERTTSIIDITGGYSGEKKKMLNVCFTYSQYNELINIVNTNDKTAFVTIHPAHEINGEGW